MLLSTDSFYSLRLFYYNFLSATIPVISVHSHSLLLCVFCKADYDLTCPTTNACLLYYRLGLMKTDFHMLSTAARNALITNFARISQTINEQELCSILHGLAKMDARWDDVPETLKEAILSCSLSRMKIGIDLRPLIPNDASAFQ